MPSVLVRVPLEDGGSIVVEASEEITRGGVQPVARAGEVVVQAEHTLEQALDETLRPLAEALLRRLKELAQRPTEVSVTLGLKLSAEAGVVISKAAGEASIQVTLKWEPGTT